MIHILLDRLLFHESYFQQLLYRQDNKCFIYFVSYHKFPLHPGKKETKCDINHIKKQNTHQSDHFITNAAPNIVKIFW